MIYPVKELRPDDDEIRAVYVKVMQEYLNTLDTAVTLDADLMKSIGLLPIKKNYPDRIIDCGVAEANMMGIASGLSAEGMIPFVHTFAAFACRRALDQVFVSGAYARLNVKILASDPGITSQLNGGTHAANEDVSAMRAIPGMTIIEPVDAVSMEAALRIAHDTYGMFYIRTPRTKQIKVYEQGSEFSVGKANILRDGSDATIIASGIEVAEALMAHEQLKKEGISAGVIDIFSVKPLDTETVCAAARKTGAIVTAENHNVVGGLNAAVAQCLCKEYPVPMEAIGIQDQFGEVGMLPWLRQRFSMTAEDIAKAVKRVITRKK